MKLRDVGTFILAGFAIIGWLAFFIADYRHNRTIEKYQICETSLALTENIYLTLINACVKKGGYNDEGKRGNRSY